MLLLLSFWTACWLWHAAKTLFVCCGIWMGMFCWLQHSLGGRWPTHALFGALPWRSRGCRGCSSACLCCKWTSEMMTSISTCVSMRNASQLCVSCVHAGSVSLYIDLVGINISMIIFPFEWPLRDIHGCPLRWILKMSNMCLLEH